MSWVGAGQPPQIDQDLATSTQRELDVADPLMDADPLLGEPGHHVPVQELRWNVGQQRSVPEQQGLAERVQLGLGVGLLRAADRTTSRKRIRSRVSAVAVIRYPPGTASITLFAIPCLANIRRSRSTQVCSAALALPG